MFSTSTYGQTIDIWNNKTAEKIANFWFKNYSFISMTCTYFFKEKLKNREVFVTARLLYQIKILWGGEMIHSYDLLLLI